MTDNALLGIGSALQRGDGASPEVFTTIAEILSIGGPSLTAGTVDATSMESLDRYAEFIAGLKDGGEVSFTIAFIPTEPTHRVTTGFLADFNSNPQPLRWRRHWMSSGRHARAKAPASTRL